jgi:hypothetical protein
MILSEDGGRPACQTGECGWRMKVALGAAVESSLWIRAVDIEKAEVRLHELVRFVAVIAIS